MNIISSRSGRISPGRLDRRSRDGGRGGSRLMTVLPRAGSPSDTPPLLDEPGPAAPPPSPTPSPGRRSLRPGSGRPVVDGQQQMKDYQSSQLNFTSFSPICEHARGHVCKHLHRGDRWRTVKDREEEDVHWICWTDLEGQHKASPTERCHTDTGPTDLVSYIDAAAAQAVDVLFTFVHEATDQPVVAEGDAGHLGDVLVTLVLTDVATVIHQAGHEVAPPTLHLVALFYLMYWKVRGKAHTELWSKVATTCIGCGIIWRRFNK